MAYFPSDFIRSSPGIGQTPDNREEKRVMQVALRVFAALSILGGVAIVGVSFVYSVAATIILGGIPLILLGIASVYSSGQIKGASQA